MIERSVASATGDTWMTEDKVCELAARESGQPVEVVREARAAARALRETRRGRRWRRPGRSTTATRTTTTSSSTPAPALREAAVPSPATARALRLYAPRAAR